MAKLWDKGFEINAEIERYTVGRDRELDLYLAQDDVLGSMAHPPYYELLSNSLLSSPMTYSKVILAYLASTESSISSDALYSVFLNITSTEILSTFCGLE